MLADDGGTANSGSNISAAATFNIVITKPRRWYNAILAVDVSGDGNVVAGDALDVINYINASGSGPVPATVTAGSKYLDVTGDNRIAANDALGVINYINAFGSGRRGTPALPIGEGEAGTDDLLMLLAIDLASQPKRRSGAR